MLSIDMGSRCYQTQLEKEVEKDLRNLVHPKWWTSQDGRPSSPSLPGVTSTECDQGGFRASPPRCRKRLSSHETLRGIPIFAQENMIPWRCHMASYSIAGILLYKLTSTESMCSISELECVFFWSPGLKIKHRRMVHIRCALRRFCSRTSDKLQYNIALTSCGKKVVDVREGSSGRAGPNTVRMRPSVSTPFRRQSVLHLPSSLSPFWL